MKIINLPFIFFFFCSSIVSAQLICQPIYALDLLQILGDDYIIDQASISLEGSVNARSKYTLLNEENESRGILLTTGTTSGAIGPNNTLSESFYHGLTGDPILTSIVGSQTFDASLIRFDFVPLVDSIELEYFFGSEEYLEYCLTDFIDLSVILIAGPGIVPDQNHMGFKSLNRVPGGSIATINSVRPVGTNVYGQSFSAMNAQFYVNNSGGSVIQYNGFTTFLKAKTNLIVGEIYTMIFAIADVGDGIYDSGLFIRSCTSCSLGIDEKPTLGNLKIVPNPACDFITIQLDEGVNTAEIEIYSMNGELLITQEINSMSTISVESLAKGTYIVKLMKDNEMISKGRFIK